MQCDKVGDLMANNLLMLIKLDTDTMAFVSLLVSIVGALAAIFAAFYANIAAFYAKKAATKHDLTRVEQNTQHVEHFSNKTLSIDTQVQPQPRLNGKPHRLNLSRKPHSFRFSGSPHRFNLSRKPHTFRFSGSLTGLSRKPHSFRFSAYPFLLRVKLWEKFRSNCA